MKNHSSKYGMELTAEKTALLLISWPARMVSAQLNPTFYLMTHCDLSISLRMVRYKMSCECPVEHSKINSQTCSSSYSSDTITNCLMNVWDSTVKLTARHVVFWYSWDTVSSCLINIQYSTARSTGKHIVLGTAKTLIQAQISESLAEHHKINNIFIMIVKARKAMHILSLNN